MLRVQSGKELCIPGDEKIIAMEIDKMNCKLMFALSNGMICELRTSIAASNQIITGKAETLKLELVPFSTKESSADSNDKIKVFKLVTLNPK